MTDIDVTIDSTQDINVSIDDGTNINVIVSGLQTANFVNANGPFYFDGSNGSTYFVYNSTTSRLELWVNGSKKMEWG